MSGFVFFFNLCAGVNMECFIMKSNDVMLLFRCLTWRSGDKQNMYLVELRGNVQLCVLGCFWGRSIYSDFEACKAETIYPEVTNRSVPVKHAHSCLFSKVKVAILQTLVSLTDHTVYI